MIFMSTMALNELVAQGFQVCFWRSSNSAEVDLLILHEDQLIPITIKAATHLKAKSFTYYCQHYHPSIGFKCSLQNINDTFINSTHVYQLPLYALFKIKDYLSQKDQA